MSARFTKPRLDTGPQRFLYISGVGDQLGTDPKVLAEVFSRFGPLEGDGIEMVAGKRFCYVVFVDIDSAIRAKDELNGIKIPELGNASFFIKFAAETVPSQGFPEPECTMSTESVQIPGLFVLREFLTEEEELHLLSTTCSVTAPWEQSLNRRVQVCIISRFR